jgi:hypothetical protein
MKCDFVQVLAKSAVAYAVAQEVLRLSRTFNIQIRVATVDTVVSRIHIPEGTPVWLCPQQVCTVFSLEELSRSPCAATQVHKLLLFDTTCARTRCFARPALSMRSMTAGWHGIVTMIVKRRKGASAL